MKNTKPAKRRKTNEHFNTSEPHSVLVGETSKWWDETPGKIHGRLYRRSNGSFFLLELTHTHKTTHVTKAGHGWTHHRNVSDHNHRFFTVSATEAAKWYLKNVAPAELRPSLRVEEVG